MTEGPPEVSVVLVSWNRREDLRIALDSLYEQSAVDFEIIAVDNGSTDGTIEMLKSEPREIHVIENGRNLGACWGKNQGILAASAPFLVFMDSDAKLISPDTLKTVLDRMKSDPGLTALGCPIYWNEELTSPWVFGIHLTDDLYIEWEKTRTLGLGADALSTCFMMIRTEKAREIGGFDPFYFYQHEDLDLFVRLKKDGGRFDVLDGPPVWHRISQVGRKVDRWFWMHFREEWRHQYLLIKNMGPMKGAYFIARNWWDGHRMRDYYVRPIRFRKFVVLFGLLPVFMLLLSPFILWQGSKNYLQDPKLKSTPNPKNP
ncbi:MAG: glycosyltransferase family 2 protein [Candidatus Omnitrophica bacterium]|nr:glycosyltransferase family 2 protein [Candidatus Omnitrophota bacterium]